MITKGKERRKVCIFTNNWNSTNISLQTCQGRHAIHTKGKGRKKSSFCLLNIVKKSREKRGRRRVAETCQGKKEKGKVWSWCIQSLDREVIQMKKSVLKRGMSVSLMNSLRRSARKGRYALGKPEIEAIWLCFSMVSVR